MEVEEIQTCKFSRVGNGRNSSSKVVHSGGTDPNEERNSELLKMANNNLGGSADAVNPLRGWQHSSRIIRVSRASGGKDRHSKVWTSKGLRDRRVRLSVPTAIQFYDLQDRLGYDQPSKAVEWLIKTAADSIAELPSLNTCFPETPKQISDEKMASGEVDLEGDPTSQHNQNHHLSLSKSACSSTSDTSKNSGLSISRPEIRGNRVKARERARERAAKEKESESTFTELLTGVNSTTAAPTAATGHQTQSRQWATPPMDYFNMGLLGSSSARTTYQGYPTQIQLGNSQFGVTADHHQHHHQEPLHQFSFVPDHVYPGGGGDGEYNLNFSISPGGLTGFNRGTLQSNSQSQMNHNIQRFASAPMDATSLPFLIGAAQPLGNHHHSNNNQFPSAGLDGRLQLYYNDGSRHSDQKGKEKN